MTESEFLLRAHFQRPSLTKPSFMLNEPVDIAFIAKQAIAESKNPLGIDYLIKNFTIYYAMRLEKRKKKPDKLVFLQRPVRKAHIFPSPIVHTTKGVFFFTTLPPFHRAGSR